MGALLTTQPKFVLLAPNTSCDTHFREVKIDLDERLIINNLIREWA
jgi:hypothetical protein